MGILGLVVQHKSDGPSPNQKDPPDVKNPYRNVTRAARESAAVIEQFCQANGQILLPLLNLIENASQVVETVIHEIGHQTLEQILVLSAEQVAGARTPGKASGEIRYYGSQPGRVQLADRKVKVKRPRLRHKTKDEGKVPAGQKVRAERRQSPASRRPALSRADAWRAH